MGLPMKIMQALCVNPEQMGAVAMGTLLKTHVVYILLELDSI